jgi:Cu/Ag efflux protein CusF
MWLLTNIVWVVMMTAAAMALFVGLSAPVLADEATGNIMAVNLDKHQIVVMDNTARAKTFELTKDCMVLINNQPGQMSDLKTGDAVTVIFERQEEMLTAHEVRCSR